MRVILLLFTMEKISAINYNGVRFIIEDEGAQRQLQALQRIYDKFNEPYIAGEIYHNPELIKRQEHIQEFSAKDINRWIEGHKLDYPYFVFTCTDPSITISTKAGNTIDQNKVYISEYLPTEPYADWDADEDDVITIYYGD